MRTDGKGFGDETPGRLWILEMGFQKELGKGYSEAKKYGRISREMMKGVGGWNLEGQRRVWGEISER